MSWLAATAALLLATAVPHDSLTWLRIPCDWETDLEKVGDWEARHASWPPQPEMPRFPAVPPRDGPFEVYYDRARKTPFVLATFRDGRLEGQSRTFDKSGKLCRQASYRGGLLDGEARAYARHEYLGSPGRRDVARPARPRLRRPRRRRRLRRPPNELQGRVREAPQVAGAVRVRAALDREGRDALRAWARRQGSVLEALGMAGLLLSMGE